MLFFSESKVKHDLDHQIYLLNRPEDYSKLDLTEAEKAYLADQLKADSFVHFSRLPELSVACLPEGEDAQAFEKARILATKVQKSCKAKHIAIHAEASDKAMAFAEGLALAAYKFQKYFSKKEDLLESIQVDASFSEAQLQELNAVVSATYLARDLVNEPLSYLTAKQLAKEAQKAGEKFGFKVEVFNKKKIESLKMGGLLAVNRGSQDPPSFSILEYKGEGASGQPIVLVGKGVVYDTGGLSLKPTPGSMDSMKSDMGGAAAVIGAISAAAANKLPIHVIGLVPATDNRPGLNAYVPGDVIRMYDGSTVEVLNTDAEGRMLLADALAYAKNYKPALVVDLATLTGAAAVAVGKYGVVVMGTASDEEFNALSTAGDMAYERTARFPFWEEYDELLKSTIADQKNIGGREGGAITAGKFLQKFTDYPWIHIDIAGPAFLNAAHHYRSQGGTGVGVRLMYNFLKSKV
ncbi:leucyl aminopeptidase family protein [Croceimicrobium hydrocarbonivorans]|uniref:Leucyl aminopeptidase n=1 Tax=Croceimicrobium hydrocarbonivorans TaxID=2761580 RepID=A0A7H0VJ27_9FLAO|nr:leucyl aminopeptidase [Croceimicrobium hydrocarbonivorans]QNR25725.1 leucyl aminopeptidase [Croceimicrobium hydrocarbonivorans]